MLNLECIFNLGPIIRFVAKLAHFSQTKPSPIDGRVKIDGIPGSGTLFSRKKWAKTFFRGKEEIFIKKKEGRKLFF